MMKILINWLVTGIGEESAEHNHILETVHQPTQLSSVS